MHFVFRRNHSAGLGCTLKTCNMRSETRDKNDAEKEKTDELRYHNTIITLTKDSETMATGDETRYFIIFSWKKIVSEFFLSRRILTTILHYNLDNVFILHPRMHHVYHILKKTQEVIMTLHKVYRNKR